MMLGYGILHLIRDLAELQRNANLSDDAAEHVGSHALQSKDNLKLIPLIDDDGNQKKKAGD